MLVISINASMAMRMHAENYVKKGKNPFVSKKNLKANWEIKFCRVISRIEGEIVLIAKTN